MRCHALALLLGLSCACAWSRPAPPVYPAIAREDGLIVRDLIVPDSGVEVGLGDAVEVQYELRLADRTLVESSRETGLTLRFEVGAGKVPRGLDQGVVGMRLFGRRRLDVPSALAFGEAGRPPQIPPGTAVVFELELIEHTPATR
jgi:peptidylprolyl isomerase